MSEDKNTYQFDGSFQAPDMDEYISAVSARLCPNCGRAIKPNYIGRPRVFCNAKCRTAFWNKHPRPDAWKFYIEKLCPVCGRKFKARKDGTHTQKYCSRSCANKARSKAFREGEDNAE